MKILLPVLGLCALALSGPAYSQATVESVVVPAQKSGPALTLWTDDIQEFIGDYKLANGVTLWLTKQGSKMYGQIGALPRHEMKAAGLRKFVAVDGKLSVHIKYTWDGQITGNVAYVDENRKGALETVYMQFAAR